MMTKAALTKMSVRVGGREVAIISPGDNLTIGRHRDNDIVILDNNPKISLPQLINEFKINTLVITTNNSPYKISSWTADASRLTNGQSPYERSRRSSDETRRPQALAGSFAA